MPVRRTKSALWCAVVGLVAASSQQVHGDLVQNWDALPAGVSPTADGVSYSLGGGWTASSSTNALTEQCYNTVGAPANGYQTPLSGGQFVYLHEDTDFRRDSHSVSTIVLSPLFTLSAIGGEMSMQLAGGNNGTVAPTTIAGIGTTLPAAEDGWQGALLIDVNGNVLQSRQRSQPSDVWEAVSFDTSSLAVDTVYQLAMASTYWGGWGWIALDDVTIQNATPISVPEPTSLGLLGAAALFALRRKRA